MKLAYSAASPYVRKVNACASLDEPPRQQHGLTPGMSAVAIANHVGLGVLGRPAHSK